MKSMTGYGKAKFSNQDLDIEIEIKSINGRYLDLKISAPRELNFFENQVRNKVAQHLFRGTVDLRINYSDHREPPIHLDKARLAKYKELIHEAQSFMGVQDDIPLQYILAEPGVIQTLNNLDTDNTLINALESTLNEAINSLLKVTLREGNEIKKEFYKSAVKIHEATTEIQKLIDPFKQELFEKLKQRLDELLSKESREGLEQRLVLETAIYVDKYDIQEELTRLSSHLDMLTQLLDDSDGKEVGKKLNFILQEMQREANTLGSKFSTTQSFKYILVIKEEIEKCREISLNVS